MEKYHQMAAQILKIELTKKKLTYKDLAKLLAEIGVKENYGGLANKINRGRFSFAFFIKCMYAIKIKRLYIPDKCCWGFDEEER